MEFISARCLLRTNSMGHGGGARGMGRGREWGFVKPHLPQPGGLPLGVPWSLVGFQLPQEWPQPNSRGSTLQKETEDQKVMRSARTHRVRNWPFCLTPKSTVHDPRPQRGCPGSTKGPV